MKYLPLFFLRIFFSSCVVDEADLSRYIGSKIQNVEEARDIEVVYTDSSYTVFILKAPMSRRVFERYSVSEEFPEGIEVTFYDKTTSLRSWLTSDFARRELALRAILTFANPGLESSFAFGLRDSFTTVEVREASSPVAVLRESGGITVRLERPERGVVLTFGVAGPAGADHASGSPRARIRFSRNRIGRVRRCGRCAYCARVQPGGRL